MTLSVIARLLRAPEYAAAATVPLLWAIRWQQPQALSFVWSSTDYPGEYGRGRQQQPRRIAVLVVRGETPHKGMAKLASLPRKGWRVSRLRAGMFLKELSVALSRLGSPTHAGIR